MQERKTDEVIIDVIIPVDRPDSSISELIRRINEQTVRVNKIYILSAVNTKRYEQTQMADGILNFSYENGRTMFNGVQLSNGDITDFAEYDKYSNITIIHISEEELRNKGTYKKVLEIAKSEYIMYMAQNVLPINREFISKLLEPFQSEKVMCTFGRHTISKKTGYIEKMEYADVFEKNRGIIEINNEFSVPISALWSYNECAIYKRESLNIISEKNAEKMSVLNEDISAFAFENEGCVAFADTFVKSIRKSGVRYIASRSFEIRNLKINNDDSIVSDDLDVYRNLVRMNVGDLMAKGRGYMGGTLISYKVARSLGYLYGKIKDLIPKEWNDSILERVYCWHK